MDHSQIAKTKRRGRFAPTPSGPMHIGNLFIALLAWLQMRCLGGQFVLRIEDIDRPRCKPEYTALLIDDLQWFGLDWDEGPDRPGHYGPYEQSNRQHLYDKALALLHSQNALYPCYCSRAELLGIASAPHGLSTEGGIYPGTCRRLTTVEQQAKELVKKPSLRFALPERSICFEDGIQGVIYSEVGAGGDFIVQRADGVIGYQLAVVVDDAAMGITDVLRGYDLLDSTARQLYLFEALGLQPPAYAHAPLLCGPDGKRLAKRHGSIAIHALRERGIAPEKLIGLLAWCAGMLDNPEPVKASELIPCYKPSRLANKRIIISKELLDKL